MRSSWYTAAAAALLAVAWPAATRAAGQAGLEVELGQFRLSVRYSAMGEYRTGAVEAIRDPAQVLFELATRLQANAPAFAAINHRVAVELVARDGAAGDQLVITEDPQVGGTVLRDGPVVRDLGVEILAAVCHRYRGACAHAARPTLQLWRCGEDLCPGQLQFGAFPSEFVNRSWALVQPRRRAPAPMSVARDAMGRYFEQLD